MKPFTYIVEVAGSCNLRCPSCPQGNLPQVGHPKGFMDVDLFRQIIDKIAHEPVSVQTVALYNWGEAFLHPRLPELIQIVKAHNFLCNVSSNFNYIHNLDEIIAARPDQLRISVSGFSQDRYQRTHKKGNIEVVKANMRTLRRILDCGASPTRVEVCYHQYLDNTGAELSQMSSFCRELGFPLLTVWAYLMPLEKNLDYFRGALPQKDMKLVDLLAVKPDQLREICLPYAETDCLLRSTQNVINADGSVALCCGTFDKKYTIAAQFLDVSQEDLQTCKSVHPLCGECMSHALHLISICQPFEAIDRAARENVALFAKSTLSISPKKKDSRKDQGPLISIGVPTYNGATFLRQTLDSLLSQNYENLEIIISDNASTDGTADICREYAEKDARIKFFANDENRGATYNFLRVLSLASGKYFMWASDHDLWQSTLLARAAAVLEDDPEVVLCYPRAERIDSQGHSLGLAANAMDTRGLSAVGRYVYLLNNISGGDMIYGLIRRQALRRLNPKTVWGVDQAILAGLALQGSFAHLPEPLFFWRKIRDESMEYRKKTVPLALDPKDSQGMLAMSMMELWRQLGEECLALVRGSSLSAAEKERLVQETKSCFTRRYGVRWPACSAPAEVRRGLKTTQAPVLPEAEATPSPAAPPLVSVIVTTQNHPERLVAAVQSVLGQTYRRHEIIVVNDGVPGAHPMVGWLKHQENITYVRHDRPRGLAAARNSGRKISRGKYLAYLNDDEIMYPDHLETLVTSLEGSRLQGA